MSSPNHQPGDQVNHGRSIHWVFVNQSIIAIPVNPKHPIPLHKPDPPSLCAYQCIPIPFHESSIVPSPAFALGNMKNLVAGCTSHLSTSQIVPARNQPFAMDNTPIFQSLGRRDARATGSSARLGVTARGIWHCTKLPGCSNPNHVLASTGYHSLLISC